MFKIEAADRKAMGVFSVIFLIAGIALKGIGVYYYWIALIIGGLMAAVSLLSGKRMTRKSKSIWHRYLS